MGVDLFIIVNVGYGMFKMVVDWVDYLNNKKK